MNTSIQNWGKWLKEGAERGAAIANSRWTAFRDLSNVKQAVIAGIAVVLGAGITLETCTDHGDHGEKTPPAAVLAPNLDANLLTKDQIQAKIDELKKQRGTEKTAPKKREINQQITHLQNTIATDLSSGEVAAKLNTPSRYQKVKTGTFDVKDGVLKFPAGNETYDELTQTHTALLTYADRENEPRIQHWWTNFGDENAHTQWADREELRTVQNKRREIARDLLRSYGIQYDASSPDLASLPESIVDTTQPLNTDGTEQLFEGRLSMPYFIPGDTTYQYLRVPAEENDDIRVMLAFLLKDEFKTQLDTLWDKILLISPEGEWHIPVALIDSAKYKTAFLWTDFTNLALTYPPDASKADRALLTTDDSQKQPKQRKYHEGNNFSVFTNGNRANLLKTSGVVQVPEEGVGFVCRDIYTGDSDHEKDARYTYPDTLALVTGLGQFVNDEFHKKYGLPEKYQIQLVVSSLGRTTEYQNKVPDSGGNATNNASSHTFYNAADIHYTDFELLDTATGTRITFSAATHPKTAEGIKDLMIGYIAKAAQGHHALARLESNSACLHVVGTDPEKYKVLDEKPAPVAHKKKPAPSKKPSGGSRKKK